MQGAIVVADKSKTVRRMVEIALAKQPFTLELCEDGQAALAAINARAPQVAIVDADLPGIDGYALAQRAAGVKVILMVGRSKQYDAARGQGAGVHSHLAKPFVTQKLIEVLFTALGQEIPDAYLFRSTTLNIPLVRKDASSASPAPKPAIGGGASLNLMGPPSSAGLSGLGVKPPALGAGGLGAGALGAKPPLPAMGRRAAVAAASRPPLPSMTGASKPPLGASAPPPHALGAGLRPPAPPAQAPSMPAPPMSAPPMPPKAPSMPAPPMSPKAPSMPAPPMSPKAPSMPALPMPPKAPSMPPAPVMPAPPAATQPAAAPSAAGPLNLSGVVHAATTQLTAQVDGLDQALVEQIAWEIIPKLAETLLKEEIARVVRERIAAAR